MFQTCLLKTFTHVLTYPRLTDSCCNLKRMHRALQIPEILSDIFYHCSPQGLDQHPCKASIDLSALARTCRTFKEPALDVLWRVLTGSSPLARSLPEAFRRVSTGNMVRSSYVFVVFCLTFFFSIFLLPVYGAVRVHKITHPGRVGYP